MDGESSTPDIGWASSQKPHTPIRIDFKETPSKIAFWNEAQPFQSEDDAFEEFTKSNKFTIERIEANDQGKMLVGAHCQALVSGEWAKCEFKVGMRVRVYENMSGISNVGGNVGNVGNVDGKMDGNVGSNVDGKVDGKVDGNVGSNIANVGSNTINTDSNVSNIANMTKTNISNVSNIANVSNMTNIPTTLTNISILTFIINDEKNAILIEDDVITVTNFCSSLDCINGPLLKDRIADLSFDFTHPSLALGIIVHGIIQACLIEKSQTLSFIIATAKKLMKENHKLLYASNTTESELINEVLKYIKHIVKFMEYGFDVSAVEQGVLSRSLGLKGSIDCYAHGSVIEIKTGKNQQVSHRAQVMLYTMMMMESDGVFGEDGDESMHFAEQIDNKQTVHSLTSTVNERMGVDGPSKNVQGGHKPIIYYAKTGELITFEMKYCELAALLQLRNKVATTREICECECPEDRPCKIYKKIQALSQDHWLRRQLEGIEAEYSGSVKYAKALVVKAEKGLGVLRLLEAHPSNDFLGIYSRTFKFITLGRVLKREGEKIHVKTHDAITLERAVYVSGERCDVFFRFMRWSLLNIAYPQYFYGPSTPNICGIILPEANLEPDLSDDATSFNSNLIFSNVIEPSDDISGSFDMDGLSSPVCKKVYVSHKDSDLSIFSDFTVEDDKLRSDLIGDIIKVQEVENIFAVSETNKNSKNEGLDSDVELTSIGEVIEGHWTDPMSTKEETRRVAFNSSDVPFLAGESTGSFQYSSCVQTASPKYATPIPGPFREEFLRLNEDQRNALCWALNCKNYQIIHGMPGTGKTTVIALLIKILAFYNKKVLIVCYTHFAIENIIRRLGSLNYYRAGHENAGHSTSERKSQDFASVVKQTRIVLGTCFCFSDPIFVNNHFDYCIIDEGSQMYLLLALIPISRSTRFCVVGDHLQLKPLARHSKEMTLSIFEYLMDGCSVLRTQYRMVDEIMNLSNILFYNGRLINGNTAKPTERSVVFIDAAEDVHRGIIQELGVCTILCYFNSTVSEIKGYSKMHVTTIDRFQGSEDDSIAVVFNPVERCSVLESRERLNVALTRARKRLTLIGDRRAMEEIPVLKELLDIIG